MKRLWESTTPCFTSSKVGYDLPAQTESVMEPGKPMQTCSEKHSLLSMTDCAWTENAELLGLALPEPSVCSATYKVQRKTSPVLFAFSQMKTLHRRLKPPFWHWTAKTFQPQQNTSKPLQSMETRQPSVMFEEISLHEPALLTKH